ncbi:MAG: tyrosine-type recombinase/integrase [Bryobacteraceae bacterium]
MHELNLFRRHVPECKHAADGVAWLRCDCPIHIYGRLPDGQTIRRGLGTRDWSIAMRKLDLLARGELTVEKPIERHTVAAGIKAFLADCARRGLGRGTVDAYENTLGRLEAALGAKAVADVTVEDIAGWCGARRMKDGAPLKPRTSVKELIHVRVLFNFLRDREWIVRNPASLVKAPKLPSQGATEPFTPVEVRRVLAGLDSYKPRQRRELALLRLRALVPLLLHSGLRISDVAALRRDRVDWKSKHLVLRQQKTGTPVRIHLPEKVVLALDALPENLFTDIGDEAEATINKLTQLLLGLGDHVGIHVRAHRFRDTFSVTLLGQGTDIRVVSLLLGHSSVVTTERSYARFMPEQQRLLDAAVKQLEYSAAAEPIAMPAAG